MKRILQKVFDYRERNRTRIFWTIRKSNFSNGILQRRSAGGIIFILKLNFKKCLYVGCWKFFMNVQTKKKGLTCDCRVNCGFAINLRSPKI